RALCEGQRLRIALLKPNAGMFGACQSDHRRRKIEPRRPRAAFGRRCRDEPRSAREIKHACAGTDPGGVEQVADKAGGRLGESGDVVLCRPLPAGVLESADRLRVESHPSAAAARATRSARSRWRGSAPARTAVTIAGSTVSGEPDPKGGVGSY